MAGVALELEVFGEQIVRRRLLRFEERITNASAAFAVIAKMLDEYAAANFASEGASGGERWQPLKPATIAEKRRKGLDDKILQATHRLRDSLAEGGSDHIREIGPLEMRWGSRVPYGIYHQRGTSKMPARKPIQLTEVQRRALAKVVQRAAVEGL